MDFFYFLGLTAIDYTETALQDYQVIEYGKLNVVLVDPVVSQLRETRIKEWYKTIIKG